MKTNLVAKSVRLPSHELFQGVRAKVLHHSLVDGDLLWVFDPQLGTLVDLVIQGPHLPELVLVLVFGRNFFNLHKGGVSNDVGEGLL